MFFNEHNNNSFYDVLHLNSTIDIGGAAAIAINLHNTALQKGLRSIYLAGYFRGSRNASVVKQVIVFNNKYFKKINSFIFRLTGRPAIFHLKPYSMIAQLILQSKIIHIHNIHGFSFDWKKVLSLIPDDKPLIWTLHDEWLLTGRCAFPKSCRGYFDLCKYCDHPEYYPSSMLKDFESDYLEKIKILQRFKNLTIVVQSDYMKLKLLSSPLGQSVVPKIVKIPNGVPDQLEVNETYYTQLLGRYKKVNKPLLAFIAAYACTYEKGFDRLLELASNIPDAIFLVVGQCSKKQRWSIPNNVILLGQLHKKEVLAVLKASDVFVLLSRDDNYPTVLLEAMHVGIPLFAVNVGAVREMVSHSSGKARVIDEWDVKKAMEEVNSLLETRGKKESYIPHYNLSSSMVKSYTELYQHILGENYRF